MASAVEAPLAFFQKAVKAVFGDSVEASQMSLSLVPEVLDSVDVIAPLAHKSFAVIDASMMEIGFGDVGKPIPENVTI